MIRKAIAIALIGVFGSLKAPFEKSLDAAQERARLRSAPLDLGLRERVGQFGFLAALSGFRSRVSLDRGPQCLGANRVGPHGRALRHGNYSSATVASLLGHGSVAHGLECQHRSTPGHLAAQ